MYHEVKKQQGFQSRLLAVFLISIVLPIVILSAIQAYYFQKRIYEENDKYFTTSLNSISTHLSNRYFTKVFLKNTWILPSEYLKRFHLNEIKPYEGQNIE